ncbi:ABC transporter substrate-binding protein [Pseudovibrio sp. Tun.PSC04-5.I4]|uniref:ABC transporter substrate-binding protein n=1 Tax=Pseudovibrio sp. Tun.PSC04-5.I4 TaxID=1798213 RepID=UPI00088C35A8|nr:ABC transporter substrate-binding protein [Pseudovibrio sp. Tun.PSC04-5.I4]SDR16595.1 iron(III) transport system substrate-binding protein [Pseudovibrio sp. Tun.PSC04-5.I4]
MKNLNQILCGAIVATIAASPSVGAAELGISDDNYSLEALIEAAKKEPPIIVVDATGKIKTMAANFTKLYGIKATGVKLGGQKQELILKREAAAGNVTHDVFNMSNLPSITSQILPTGVGTSWMPPDLTDTTPEAYQNPAITSLNPWVWAYNTEVYGDKCPVSNIWQLTDPEWSGRVSIPDPLLRNETMFWFNQLETHNDDAMREAYREHFGKDLPADVQSATNEWVKRFAKNGPNVTRKDSEVGPIIGTPGLKDPHFGFLSTSIFRKKYGYAMGICGGMKPFAGQLTPRVAVIASGTDSPNAAKLFVHFMMRGEGMEPQLIDGKIATNVNTSMPADEGSGVANYVDQLHVTDSTTTDQDFSKLQDWQDLWTIYSR